MPARFVNLDHGTPLLLPPDLRDWVPEDHLVHFLMAAAGLLDLSTARINHRGTGSEQYPPSMMLGLLIYCYARGTFSSRRIKRLTHENVAVRLLCADRHPAHDSLCTFRRENRALLESSFHQVLEVAARGRVRRVGAVPLALDGTKILASARKHSAVSHGHAVKQMVLLEEQIAGLLAKRRTRRTARRWRLGCRCREKLHAGASASKSCGKPPPSSRPGPQRGTARNSPPARRSRADANPSRRQQARGPRTSTTSPTPRAA